MNLTKKQLIDYYSNYYFNNFLRDFRYIYDDKSQFNEVLNAKKVRNAIHVKPKALKFLTSANHNGKYGLLEVKSLILNHWKITKKGILLKDIVIDCFSILMLKMIECLRLKMI